MSKPATGPPRHPPPWFVHTAWRVHRALHSLSGGRFVWTTSNKRGWGALRLTTIGRKSGHERSVIIGYLEEGPDLVALARTAGTRAIPRGGSTSRRTRTPSFDWRTSSPAWCAHAVRPGRSVIGCGSAGSQSIRGSTRMRSSGRPRRRSSSSNPAPDRRPPAGDDVHRDEVDAASSAPAHRSDRTVPDARTVPTPGFAEPAQQRHRVMVAGGRHAGRRHAVRLGTDRVGQHHGAVGPDAGPTRP